MVVSEMSSPVAVALREAWTTKGREISIVDRPQQWSGAALLKQTALIASSLARNTVRPGEPVLVLVANRAVDFSAMLALWELGAVVVPVHQTAPGPALSHLVATTGARILVNGAVEWPTSVHALPGVAQDPLVTLLDRPVAPPDPVLRDAALVVFTSGSTGHPKGVVLSHTALAAKLANNGSLLAFDDKARTQLVLQITFSFGMWLSLLTLISRSVLVIEGKFQPAEAISSLLENDITRTAVVPTMLRSILMVQNDPGVSVPLERLRKLGHLQHLYTGGEVYLGSLAQAVSKLLPTTEIFNIYGLTETATSDFFLGGEDVLRYPGAIGRPALGVAYRIIGGDGYPVMTGEVGELQIRTETAMSGYLGQPEMTASAYTEDYFHTGDLARLSSAGLVEVVGRAKDVISRGGNKVYPQEIEVALQSHPAVTAALAVGVPDAVMGERIHVAVVLSAPVSPKALLDWAATYLDRFKLPDVIHVVAELPTGRAGKSDRGQVRSFASNT